MTFGDEVRFEDTWGHALEKNLGSTIQILNFGVSGYGLNQAFIRYQRDARPWKPQIVVVGISSEMIRRMISVYNFLIYPDAAEVPFARPRYVLDNGSLLTINQPVPTPLEIYAHHDIKELPFLNYDGYYRPSEWERESAWKFLHKFYLFRFLVSIHPPLESPRTGALSETAMKNLSLEVLRAFVREIRESGAVPLIIFFPYKYELPKPNVKAISKVPLGSEILKQSGVNFVDMTSCLVEGKAYDQFMPGTHYSPTANALIAACLKLPFQVAANHYRDR